MRSVIIVVPCFNEASRIDGEAFLRAVRSRDDLGFVFVDDGSSDRTRALLEELAAQEPEALRVVGLDVNQGKAEAVRQGVLVARDRGAEYLGYWDADLSTPLELIDDFRTILDRHEHVNVVLGCRVQRLGAEIRRGTLRHYLGRLFGTAASLVLGLAVYDTQCGAKLFRVNADLDTWCNRPFATRWVFDVEILARMIAARRASGDSHPERCLYELPLAAWKDVPGSKLGVRQMAGAVWDLLSIRRSLR